MTQSRLTLTSTTVMILAGLVTVGVLTFIAIDSNYRHSENVTAYDDGSRRSLSKQQLTNSSVSTRDVESPALAGDESNTTRTVQHLARREIDQSKPGISTSPNPIDSAPSEQMVLEEDDSNNPRHSEATAEILASVLAIANNREVFYLQDELSEEIERIAGSIELQLELLTAYMDLKSESERQVLASLLAATASPGIETYAIEKVTSATSVDDQMKWTELLRATGIRTEVAQNKLLALLPEMENPDHMAMAINSIVPDKSMKPEQREHVQQNIISYLNNANESVRASAVNSIARWITDDQTQLIEQAMSDASPKVREAAIASGVQSDFMKRQLISILQDDTDPIRLRQRSFMALTNYSLQEHEQHALDTFRQQHISSSLVQAIPDPDKPTTHGEHETE